jgi:hypothetical protein
MNEILFRGKTEDGKWVYGLPDYGDFEGTINVIKEFKDGVIKSYKVISETVAPYVGVTDNTGQRIFRDDRCTIATAIGSSIETVCKESLEGGYLLYTKEDYAHSVNHTYCGAKSVKVVGTIHD